MLLKEKLLTIVRNYLFNGFSDRNRVIALCFRERIKHWFTCIYSGIHRIWIIMDAFDMAFWGKNVQLEQKKIIFDNKNSKYSLIKNEVFLVLSLNLVTSDKPDNEGLRKLSFDKYNTQQNRHYPEAEEHLEKDIGNFLEQFNGIKNKVSAFNKKLDKFKEGV